MLRNGDALCGDGERAYCQGKWVEPVPRAEDGSMALEKSPVGTGERMRAVFKRGCGKNTLGSWRVQSFLKTPPSQQSPRS